MVKDSGGVSSERVTDSSSSVECKECVKLSCGERMYRVRHYYGNTYFIIVLDK